MTPPVTELASSQRWIWGWAQALVVVAGLFFGLSEIRSRDVWFHLRTGKEIVETRSIPRSDMLSHTRPGARWVTHEWAFEVPAYLVHEAAGERGLVAVKAVVVALAALILLWALRAAGAGPLAATLTICLALWVALPRLTVRPQVVSALMAAAFLWLCFSHRASTGRRIFWVAPLALVWANIHSGVVVGLGILGAFALEETIRRRSLGPAAWATLAAFLCALVNPHGFAALWYPFWLVYSGVPGMDLAELRSPEWFGAAHAFAMAAGLGCLLALRRVGLAGVVIAVAGIFIGISRDRGALDLAVMGAPALALGIDTLVSLAGRWLEHVRRLSMQAGLATAAVVIILVTSGHEPSLATSPYGIPRGAMAFVEAQGLAGNMWNTHGLGSWITWTYPQRKVFYDGRNEVYSDLFRELELSSLAELTERYGLGYAVVEYSSATDNMGSGPIIEDWFAESADWTLVYFDDVTQVFVRHLPEHAAVLQEHAYRVLRPGWVGPDYLVQALREPSLREAAEVEARRAVAAAPGSWRARSILAEILCSTGRSAEALSVLESSPPGYGTSFALGKVHLASGNFEAAAVAFREALAEVANLRGKRAGARAPAWNNLGIAYLRWGKYGRAAESFRAAIELQPDLLSARRNLVVALEMAGQAGAATTAKRELELLIDAEVRNAVKLAQQFIHQGLAEKARVTLVRAAELQPDNVAVLYLLGVSENIVGRTGDAEGHFRQVLAAEPRHPFVRLELGDVLSQIGKGDEARAHLEVFLARKPAPQWAERARGILAKLNSP